MESIRDAGRRRHVIVNPAVLIVGDQQRGALPEIRILADAS